MAASADDLPDTDIQVRGLNSDALERFRKVISDHGGPKKTAADAGIPLSTLNHAFYGRSEPKVGLLAALADATGVSMDWMMFGDRAGAGTAGQAQSMVLPSLTAAADVVSIPFYDVRVSAGPGARPLSEEPARYMEIGRRMLEMLGLKPSDAAMMPVQGDSGLPNMADGDYVLVDRSATDLRDGGMYVIGIDDDVVVKRVERLLDRSVLLRSDNPAYRPQTVSHSDAERLRVIGRVKWAIRPF